MLMNVLNRLVDKGNTVIVIEHNLDVIKMADYLIDMGPEGGKEEGSCFPAEHRKRSLCRRKAIRRNLSGKNWGCVNHKNKPKTRKNDGKEKLRRQTLPVYWTRTKFITNSFRMKWMKMI